MLSQFQTYQIALQFHRSCRDISLPGYLKDQLLRASSSIAFNISEGSAKPTKRDQLKYYFIALGSLRESQTALDLAPQSYPALISLADRLGGMLFRLCHPKS